MAENTKIKNAELDAMQAALEQIYRETTDERSKETARAAIRAVNNIGMNECLHEEMIFQTEHEIADLTMKMGESVDGENSILVALASVSVLLIASRETTNFHYLSMIAMSARKALQEIKEMVLKSVQ